LIRRPNIFSETAGQRRFNDAISTLARATKQRRGDEMFGAPQQAALYYARKNRKAREAASLNEFRAGDQLLGIQMRAAITTH